MPRIAQSSVAIVAFACIGCAPSPFVEVDAADFVVEGLRGWSRASSTSRRLHGIRFLPKADAPAGKAPFNGSILTWDFVRGRSGINFSSSIQSFDHSPDGRLLATAHSGKVRLTDRRTLKLDHVQSGWKASEIAFSADSSRLLGITDNTCRVWDIAGRRFTASREFAGNLAAMHFIGDRSRVLLVDVGGVVSECDATTLEVGRTFRVPAEKRVEFAPDGDRYAVINRYTVEAVPYRDAPDHRLIEVPRSVSSVAYSPDARRLAVSWGAPATFIDLKGLEILGYWPFPPPPDGGVTVWDLEEDREIGSFALGDPVSAVTWSPDGTLLATVDLKQRVRLWRTRPVEP